jgi:hypothetical protein
MPNDDCKFGLKSSPNDDLNYDLILKNLKGYDDFLIGSK